MRRRAARAASLAALTAFAGGLSAPPAAAQDERVRTIVADAVDDDVYVEQAPIVAPERVAALARRIAATDQRWAFVVLDADPGNAKVLARDVVTDLRSVTGEHTTVLVLTPPSIGAESVVEDYQARLDDELTNALPVLDRNPVAGLAAVFEALSGEALPDAATAAGEGAPGRGRGSTALAAIAVAIAAGFVAAGVLRRR
jgi:hypothetical protein